MPDEYKSTGFTVEQYTDNKWELVWTYNSLEQAISRFRGMLLASSTSIVRITSPEDTSIYA